jgi:hypothetical protein
MTFALAGMLAVALAAAPAADISGKWSGTLTAQRDDGSKHEDTALLILTQKGTTITGTVGGHENDRHPITKGTIDGNKIALEATLQNGRVMTFALSVENEDMKGTIQMGERTAQIVLKKQKE